MLLQHCSGLDDSERALLPGPHRTEGKDHPVRLADYIAVRLKLAEANKPKLQEEAAKEVGKEDKSEKNNEDDDEEEGEEVWETRAPWSARALPGKSYHYSNLGFTILGLVVECCSGIQLPDLAKQRLFAPLGMTHTTFTLRDALDIANSDTDGTTAAVAEPHGYKKSMGHYGVAEYPAAGVRSSVRDLLKFLSIFTAHADLDGAENNDDQAGSEKDKDKIEKDKKYEKEKENMLPPPPPTLLTAQSIRTMLPASYTRGLAWWGTDTWYGARAPGVWMHGGFMPGIRSHMYFYPRTQLGIVLLQNGENLYQGTIDEVMKRVVL